MAMQIVMINLNAFQSMKSDLQRDANVTTGQRKRKKGKKKIPFTAHLIDTAFHL